MLGRRRQISEVKPEKKKWQLELESTLKAQEVSSKETVGTRNGVANTNKLSDNYSDAPRRGPNIDDNHSSSTVPSLIIDHGNGGNVNKTNRESDDTGSKGQYESERGKICGDEESGISKFGRRKAKYVDDEDNEIRRELLVDITEQDLEELIKEKAEEDKEEEEKGADGAHLDEHTENGVVSNESVMLESQEGADSTTDVSHRKRKRYAWMDSDDEDVTESSEEELEDEEEEEEDDANQSSTKGTGSIPLGGEYEGGKQNLSDLGSPNSYAGESGGNVNLCSIGSPSGYDEYSYLRRSGGVNTVGGSTSSVLASESTGNVNSANGSGCSNNALKVIKKNKCENDMYEAVRFAYVTNISWEAKLNELKTFLERETKQKVLSVIPDTSIGTSTSKPVQPLPPHHHGQSSTGRPNTASHISSSTSESKVNDSNHKGRAYAEFISYQALQSALFLNETLFMGRPIKILKAYRRNNQFYLLHTPAHYRFYHSLANMNPNKNKKKVHKVDGGFNWAK